MNLLRVLSVYILGVQTAFLPCFFPILPVFLAYVAKGNRRKAILVSTLFSIGLVSSFIVYGVTAIYAAWLISPLLNISLEELTVTLGIVFIALGFSMFTPLKEIMTRLTLPLPRLRGMSLLNSVILGFFFSLIAAPCASVYLFAIISSAIIVTYISVAEAIVQLIIFGIGISTPFLILGVLTQKTSLHIHRKISKSFIVRRSGELAGILMVALGVVTMLSIGDFYNYLHLAGRDIDFLANILFAILMLYLSMSTLIVAKVLSKGRLLLLTLGALLWGIATLLVLLSSFPQDILSDLLVISKFLFLLGTLAIFWDKITSTTPISRVIVLIPIAYGESILLITNLVLAVAWIFLSLRTKRREMMWASYTISLFILLEILPADILRVVNYAGIVIPVLKLTSVFGLYPLARRNIDGALGIKFLLTK